jgi:tRNA-specific 2-thiouridylase
VAALLLREQGYRPVGATLKLWTDPESNTENSCCSGEAVQRARRVAHRLGIPHFTLDAGEIFFADVVQYFLAEYSAGRTPNPCAKCNARLRFGLLAKAAARLGLGKIATGHYARLTGDPPRLARGVYGPKDQSYVLSEIAPELLEHTLFPLGELDKPAVRALAREAGLEGFDAPESQEICFVPQAGHRTFLRRRLGVRPGAIVDATGRPLGRHSGTYNFTIGQRRGHGVAAAEPLFVTRLDADKAEVVIGPHDGLAVEELVLEDVTVHRLGTPARGLVQTRSSGEPSPGAVARPAGVAGDAAVESGTMIASAATGRLSAVESSAVDGCGLANGRHATGNAMAEGGADGDQAAPGSGATDGVRAATAAADPDPSEPGRWLVRFDSPAFGIAPGQTAVLYDGDEVVLAGTIVETHAPTV